MTNVVDFVFFGGEVAKGAAVHHLNSFLLLENSWFINGRQSLPQIKEGKKSTPHSLAPLEAGAWTWASPDLPYVLVQSLESGCKDTKGTGMGVVQVFQRATKAGTRALRGWQGRGQHTEACELTPLLCAVLSCVHVDPFGRGGGASGCLSQ